MVKSLPFSLVYDTCCTTKFQTKNESEYQKCFTYLIHVNSLYFFCVNDVRVNWLWFVLVGHRNYIRYNRSRVVVFFTSESSTKCIHTYISIYMVEKMTIHGMYQTLMYYWPRNTVKYGEHKQRCVECVYTQQQHTEMNRKKILFGVWQHRLAQSNCNGYCDLNSSTFNLRLAFIAFINRNRCSERFTSILDVSLLYSKRKCSQI